MPGKSSRPGALDDADAIVRVDATTICGTDLHILKGDVPAVVKGRILGHEAVGTVWVVDPACAPVLPRRPCTRLLHQRVRILPVLPRGPLRAVPGGRRLGPRPQGRPVRRPPRSCQAVRRRRHGEQHPRGPAGRDQGPDRAAGRRRGHRGRRRARRLRAGRQAGPGGGGRIASTGVHGEPVALHLEEQWIRTSRITAAWWTPPPRRP